MSRVWSEFVKSLLLNSFDSEFILFHFNVRNHLCFQFTASCNFCSCMRSASMEWHRRAWLVLLFLVDPGRTRLRYNDKPSDGGINKSPAGTTLAPIVGRDVQIHHDEEPDQAVDAPPAPSGETSSQPQNSQKRGVQLRQDRKRKWISEIRPPNGSKKVWLGSYHTSQEAAAAYDVGIFYFKKRIPYHFADSHSFLLNLNLPPSDTSEGIRLGAQELRRTAQLAAQRVRNIPGKVVPVIQPAASHQSDHHSNKFLQGEVVHDHNSTIFPLDVVPNSSEFADSASTCKSLSTVFAGTPASESPTGSDGVDIVER